MGGWTQEKNPRERFQPRVPNYEADILTAITPCYLMKKKASSVITNMNANEEEFHNYSTESDSLAAVIGVIFHRG